MSHLPYAAYVKLRMNAPRPDGFSSNEEFATLNTIEDALVASLTETSTTLYVGRLTSEWRREFFFYASDVSDWRERVSEFAAMHPGYAFDNGSHEDPDWRCYLEFLRSSPVDRQRIENRRVCFCSKRRAIH
jgi:hypothetical protein